MPWKRSAIPNGNEWSPSNRGYFGPKLRVGSVMSVSASLLRVAFTYSTGSILEPLSMSMNSSRPVLNAYGLSKAESRMSNVN